jgi:hypothetical protein
MVNIMLPFTKSLFFEAMSSKLVKCSDVTTKKNMLFSNKILTGKKYMYIRMLYVRYSHQ